jgi:hypothetical protein
MSNQFELGDLRWGTLNNFQDTLLSNSGDRRREHAKDYLNSALRRSYGRDTLRGVNAFYGIVLHHRITYGHTNPISIHKIIDQYTTVVRGPDDSTKPEHQGRQIAYKVYIPEMSAIPAPQYTDDPILYTYPDIYQSSQLPQVFPPGTIVKVEFGDIDNLLNPIIIAVEGQISMSFPSNPCKGKRMKFLESSATPLRPFGRASSAAINVKEQQITGIDRIKKANSNPSSNQYVHWGDRPAMVTLLKALNVGAEKENITITITSALRPPFHQARIMFQNYRKRGIGSAKAKKYLTGLYGAKVGPLADAFAGYTTEVEAGTAAGHMVAPGGSIGPISSHQRGAAVDVRWGATPPPASLSRALKYAAVQTAALDILMESDHYHIKLTSASGPSKFRTKGPSSASLAAANKEGLKVGELV